ncbi:flagellar hook-associated protein FlgL [Paenibacillus dauci]|uniref:flagellar hook-associated protein FlgL n=1 Tax=Paenibacillus dauci TaxID=1567106 RepID=UPI00061A05AD|nr:flagellar hook-associated protein FlgL [Paenibacillus dauci]
MLRVTNGMKNNQLLMNLNRNARAMQNTQEQMSTGMKINRPSDDPVGITYSLRYRADVASAQQYQKNVDSSISWLEYNDTVLTQTNDVMQKLRELTVQAANDTNPQSALDSINSEVAQLKEQFIDIANSQLNGKYIFNGQNYNEKPYQFSIGADGTQDITNGASVQTDTGTVNYMVGDNIKLPINTTGNEVFGQTGETDNVFNLLNNISAALKNGDIKELSNQLANIDTRVEKVLKAQSEIGAKTNRVELMQSRLGDMETNLTSLQSKVEDADYAKLLVKSQTQENIYTASLSAGAKIISTTLVDFLR